MEEEANGGCIFRVFRLDLALNYTCCFEVFGFHLERTASHCIFSMPA